MRRHLLGTVTAIMLIVGTLSFFAPEGWGLHALAGMLLKSGAVLGVLWLALPGIERLLDRVPPWLAGTMIVGLIVMIARPKTAILILPLLAILWMLVPRAKR